MSFISIIYLRFTPRVFFKTNIEPLANIQRIFSVTVTSWRSLVYWERGRGKKEDLRENFENLQQKDIGQDPF